MDLNQAIILAGGLGTRLRSVVSDLPKCMAPVAGQPFLFYVINHLRLQGIEEFIFSLGYKHELIESYLKDQFSTMKYQCIVEDEPLGTGGAIRAACEKASTNQVLVVNGDTLFSINVETVEAAHQQSKAACTVALKPMLQFDRYGVVELEPGSRIKSFREKQYYETGLINGGTYILDVANLLEKNLPQKFSFEKDYLERLYKDGIVYGVIQDEYFIDIGIPEDYAKAQADLAKPRFDSKKVDNSWSLFLDRDGVLNHDKPGSYIFNPGEFVLYEGVAEAMEQFASQFGKIFITTNQRGVGRGLMSEADLAAIHHKMKSAIHIRNGRIDAIYVATSVDDKDFYRKPNPGMARLAKKEYPAIDFSRSIMVGNNISDMEFGRHAGMYTVFLKTTQPGILLPHPAIDLAYDTLYDFAKAL